jgi:subtilisin family serine protease
VIAGATPGSWKAGASVSPKTNLDRRAAPDLLYAPGEVLVKPKASSGTAKADVVASLASAYRLTVIEELDAIGVTRFRIDDGSDVVATAERLSREPGVEYAEPNWAQKLDLVPNDTLYDGYDHQASDLQAWEWDAVNAPAAWDLTTGRPDVVVAVIDSGVDLVHPDLSQNLWRNPDEIAGNNVDDDGNGFVDDVNGFDFGDNDGDPRPNSPAEAFPDHGTFVSTCAVGRGNDGVGVAGAAWNCSLMSLKVMNAAGDIFVSSEARAIIYAADNGADVINLSLGSIDPCHAFPPSSVRDAINHAIAANCVVVASAGNENSPCTSFPAGFDGVISVGASDHDFANPKIVDLFGQLVFDASPGYPAVGRIGSGNINGRAVFSEFGPDAVDVVAPGIVMGGLTNHRESDILSFISFPGQPSLNGYDVEFGTSFSGPIVAGLAALIISRDRDLNGARVLTSADVVDMIQTTATDLPDTPGDTPDAGAAWDNHGRVNFGAAIAAVPQVPQFRIDSVTPSSAARKSTVDVTVAGNLFDPGATVSFGTKIKIVSTTIASPMQINARIKIKKKTDVGPHDVVVTNPGGTSVTCLGCFTVN